MSHIGRQLRVLREEAELSQMQLANQLSTSKSSINMYERDEREPSFVMLETIADYFNVDIEYLLGRQQQRRLLTVHEGKVISAYRGKPELQPRVDKLLDVQPEKETAPSNDDAVLSVAARGTPRTDEQFDKIFNAEDTLEKSSD